MPTPSSPDFNQSVMLFGGARYLSVDTNKLPTNNFTISFRVRGGSGTAFFYGYTSFNSYQDTSIAISIEGGVRLRLGNLADGGEVFIPFSSTSADLVHYIGLTFKENMDTGETIIGIFIDGNMTYKTFTLISENKPMKIGGEMYLGTAPPRGQNQEDRITESDLFSGTLTDLNMWKAVLTADELVRDVKTSIPIREGALSLSLPLDTDHYDFQAEAFIDLSPNKINARNNVMTESNYAYMSGDSFDFPVLSRTFETWIRCGMDSSNGTLLSYGDVSNSDHPNDGGSPWTITSGMSINDQSTGINAADGQWHHIAVVTEVTPGPDEWSNTGKDSVYLDGVLKYTGVSNNVNQKAGQPLLIGAKNSQADDQVFQGALNQVKLWSVARTAAQILDSFQNGTPPAPGEAGLVPFNNLNQSYRPFKIIEQLPNGNLTASETPIISVTTDLMQNYKHAQVMGQQQSFQALQTGEGHALFFSISSDNIFYVTIEMPGHATGWNKVDLSSSIFQSDVERALYAPKLFRVAQNATTGAINMVLVFGNILGDVVYTAWNLPNTDATWNAPLPWQLRKFDAPVEGFSTLGIKDVHLLESAHSEFLVVDINLPFLQNGSPYRRYFLDFSLTGGPIWKEHDLPLDFDAAIYSVIGKRGGETVEGIYTLGAVVDRYKLVYTPLSVGQNQPNQSIELILPQPEGVALSSYAIAAVPNSAGETDLFVAGNKQLFFFSASQQQNGSTGQAVDLPPTNVFMNVSKLRVHNGDGHVFVWGLNQQGRLFYTQCALGQELQTQAWSTPSVILTNASMAATYLNAANQSHVLFAFNSNNELLQLSQDSQTAMWSKRSIVLPAVSTEDVIELYSYTSHVVVTDGSSLPKADVKVAITATSPVSVYVNDIYTILSPTLPLNITTDATGNLTIIQETADLVAVCYRFNIEGIEPLLVNPMSGVFDTIKNIQTGADLMKVRVTDDQNNPIPLIDPAKATGGTPDALAKVMQQLADTLKYVPADGSKHQSTGGISLRSTTASSNRQVLWGIRFENGEMTHYEGAEAIARFGIASRSNIGMVLAEESLGEEIIDDIGSFFNWVKDEVSSLFDAIENFVVEVVEGVISFVFKIAGQVFVFLIDSLVAAISAFMSFLDWVGVDTQKLRKWLGYVFDWDDILLTHRVFKSFFSTFLDYGIKTIESYEDQLLGIMDQAKNYVKNWAGIMDNLPDGFSSDSPKNITAGTNPIRGQKTPAFNMINYHLKNNAAGSGFGKDIVAPLISGDLSDKFSAIADAVKVLKAEFDKLFNDNSDPDSLKKTADLSFKEIFTKILGIVTSEILDAVKAILAELFKLFNAFLEGIKAVLISPIEIPVLSHIYKNQLTKGDDLSILDVACLIAAIPVTVVFKIVTGANMFAAGPETDKLIQANDFSVFQAVLAKPNAPAVRSAVADPNAPIVHTDYENWVLASGIMALVSAVAISITTALSKPWGEEEQILPTDPVAAINGILYFPYVMPDVVSFIGGDKSKMEAWEKFNALFILFGCLKAATDVSCAFRDPKFLESNTTKFKRAWGTDISPWADLIINGLWNIPVGMSICSPKNTTPTFKENIAGSFFFDFSGMLSPVIAYIKNPYVLAGSLIANTAFNIIYGSLTVAASERVFNRRD